METEYNDKVMAHFLAPHNVGTIDNPDGVGKLGDADCGDVFVMSIKVRDKRLVDIKYLVHGCGAAIATCSALSDLAQGMTLVEALHLTDDDIASELGGLPLEKMHCSNYAATVLHHAIFDYYRRKGIPDTGSSSLHDWREPYIRAMRPNTD